MENTTNVKSQRFDAVLHEFRQNYLGHYCFYTLQYIFFEKRSNEGAECKDGWYGFRIWLGDEVSEDSPKVTLNNINFGFGEWIDDTHLNGEVSEANAVADYIGCKFGLYVSSGGDRTIRFDDIKALEGNPEGAFNIVCPKTEGIETGIRDIRM